MMMMMMNLLYVLVFFACVSVDVSEFVRYLFAEEARCVETSGGTAVETNRRSTERLST